MPDAFGTITTVPPPPPDISGTIDATAAPVQPTAPPAAPVDPTAPTNITTQGTAYPGAPAHTTQIVIQHPPTQPDAPQPQQTPPPAPTPQQAAAAHDQLFGRAAKAVMGALTPPPITTYSVDPGTGKTVVQKVPNTRGSIWTNMIASAILGGAAAHDQEHNGSMLGGAVAGGRAAIERNDAQAAAQGQAQQKEFENQLKRNQEERENQKLASELSTADLNRIHVKAMVGHLNQQTLNEAQEMHGKSLDEHTKLGEQGKANLSDYANNPDIKPLGEHIPESEMAQWMKDHPGASAMLAQPTGVVPHTYIDPATGKQVNDYQSEYTIYDPHSKVQVSADTISKWKKAGLDTANLQPGQTLDATQYLGAFSQFRKKQAEQNAQDKIDLAQEEGKAKVGNLQAEAGKNTAETAKNYAEAAHARAQVGLVGAQASKIRQEISAAAEEAGNSQLLSTAAKNLQASGYDPSKLPVSQKAVLGGVAASKLALINDQMTSLAEKAKTDPAAKQQYMDLAKQKDAWGDLSKYSVADAGAGLNEDLTSAAIALAHGKMAPTDLSRYPAKDKEKIFRAVNNLNENWRQSFATRQAFTNPDHKQAQMLQSVNKVVEHVDRFKANSKDLGFAPLFGTGHDVTDSAKATATDVLAISDEMGKLLKNGVASEGEVNRWNNELRSSIPHIRDSAINEISKVMGAQYKAMNQSYRKGTGENLDDDYITGPAHDWLRENHISISGSDSSPASSVSSASTTSPKTAATNSSGTPQRKSLDDIFGTK